MATLNTNKHNNISMKTNNYKKLHEQNMLNSKEMFEGLEKELQEWKSKKRGLLTTHEIEFLYVLAEKHFTGRRLNPSQRVDKSFIHDKVGYGVRDISYLVSLGFIGWDSRWDPLGICICDSYRQNPRLDEPINPPYKMDIWKKEISSDRLARIVEKFVDMYGEEYAIPLAKAIERGLKRHTDRSEILGNHWNNTSVEVPIIKRSY